MDDLDFSYLAPPAASPPAQAVAPAPVPPAKPAQTVALPHDPQLAARFFRIAGEEEVFEAGSKIFAEQETHAGLFGRRARMYFLVEGQVALSLKGRPLYMILPGETFGELAIISETPRSATATAFKKSLVLSLDEKRALASLKEEPGFALQLVSSLTGQMRRSVDKLLAAGGAEIKARQGGSGLNSDQLKRLRAALGDPLEVPMKKGETVVSQGAQGANMFVVLDGRVAVGISGKPVESIGRGETFGEAALLGTAIRSATAVAEEEGAWLPMNRDAFLKVVKAHPDVGAGLLRSMCGRIAHLNSQMAG
ncbi:MAG: cyclic nucleotide-binding domain-containing protein [Burkholderiales bacterium]|nr:cyclic nucleotide-binding domain-containing protein [Burkholderiales bacterium]